MKIQSFAPCSGWYFVFKNGDGGTTYYPLAGWAVRLGEGDEPDSVVGMVSVEGGGPGGDSTASRFCSLAIVPPLNGIYEYHAADPSQPHP